jgi:Fe-S-cluster containining protein
MQTHDDRSQRFLDSHEELKPGQRFRFACHPQVPCFGACCSALTLMLTPHDALRLRRATGQSSREFITVHAEMAPLPDSGLPLLRLRMLDGDARKCPFVRPEGCSVYADRPGACRTYPLGRATKPGDEGSVEEQIFVIRERHCRGFEQQTEWTPETWLADQGLIEYNAANDRYMALASGMRELCRTSGRSLDSRHTGMAGLALYQPDEFQVFLRQTGLLERLDLSDERKAAILADEAVCLDFGYGWLELSFLGKTENLQPKE